MRTTSLHILSLAASVLFAPLASAHSQIRNPIGALSTVQNATIHTHNGRIHALSEFDLTFNIRNNVFVKLALEPNHDILGEGASISYLAEDGSISSTETIDRLAQRVYMGTGWVQRPSIGQDMWRSVGWARIVVAQDGKHPLFEGAFAVDLDHHHIQSSRNYASTRHGSDPEIETSKDGEEYLVVWRDSDILAATPQLGHDDLRRNVGEEGLTCESDQLSFNVQPDHPVYVGAMKRSEGFFGAMDFSGMLSKRQVDSTTGGNGAGVNLTSTIGQTAGCPTTRKIALVGLALDCNYIADFNSSDSAKANALSQINQASAVWEKTFNITLAAGKLVFGNNQSCPGTPAQATLWDQTCSDSVDINARLNYFSAWRGLQRDSFSHWTLFSTCNTQAAVGLAWLGQACVQTAQTNPGSSTGNGGSSSSETVSGANVIVRTRGATEWQIIAHETGHTYGAVHDCYSETCADHQTLNAQQCCPLSSSVCDAGEKYIMNPSTSQGISDFSMCSIGNICSAMSRNSVNSSCLTSNRQVITSLGEPQCGNGIVEPGEDCDCGGTSGCMSDKCCNPATCKFTQGSVCDDANEDCCRNCQLATNGTICRASTGSCDPAEVCSGTSALCPADVTAPDGNSCGSSLQCASGQCTSRDQQCKTVMGSYTQSNDTHACGDTGCTISCAAPEFGYGVCYGLQQNFLDGTSCNDGGKCRNGQCQGGSAVGGWIKDHQAIIIGVCAAIGGLLLLSLLGCLCRCCGRRRRVQPRGGAVPPPPMRRPIVNNGWHVPPPPPMRQREDTGGNFARRAPPPPPPMQSQGWANDGSRNYMEGGWTPPSVPPPAYPARGNSVRYA